MSPIASKSTQSFLPIREIREGVVILKDGSMRAILMASSLNFALKSEEEQTAIILQYQNLLNSLDFPVQFFVQSRKLDIEPYITTLEDAYEDQPNELLKIQIREYIEFIKNFVKSVDIVSKTFYVVVPYTMPTALTKEDNPLTRTLGFLKKKQEREKTERRDIEFEEAKIQLQQRAGVVQAGLSRVGIRTASLTSEELIELFYKLFNPGEAEKEITAGRNLEEMKI